MTLFRLVALAVLIPAGCKKTPPAGPSSMATSPVEAPVAPPPHVQEMVANFSRVFFEFDSSSLDASSKAALDENVRIMREHPDVQVELQGHADERGTTEYNLALGARRADAVKRYMSSAGVAASRLTVVSYGEERPIASGSNESAWSKNRRAEFRIAWSDEPGVSGTVD